MLETTKQNLQFMLLRLAMSDLRVKMRIEGNGTLSDGTKYHRVLDIKEILQADKTTLEVIICILTWRVS